MKCPNLSLGDFDLSSRYILKRSKIDISENVEFLLRFPASDPAKWICRQDHAGMKFWPERSAIPAKNAAD
jgi:hypothetical protein